MGGDGFRPALSPVHDNRARTVQSSEHRNSFLVAPKNLLDAMSLGDITDTARIPLRGEVYPASRNAYPSGGAARLEGAQRGAPKVGAVGGLNVGVDKSGIAPRRDENERGKETRCCPPPKTRVKQSNETGGDPLPQSMRRIFPSRNISPVVANPHIRLYPAGYMPLPDRMLSPSPYGERWRYFPHQRHLLFRHCPRRTTKEPNESRRCRFCCRVWSPIRRHPRGPESLYIRTP
jgi:hypothetical protein